MRFFIAFFLLVPCMLKAQMTIRIVGLPANTKGNEFYVAGSFNNWNPHDSLSKFVKVGNCFRVIIPAQQGELKYKITQGSWELGEGTISGAHLENRSIAYVKDTVVDITILGWEQVVKQSTALPNVKIVNERFYIPQLKTYRSVSIYLPSSYELKSKQRYPVLYMHDGQNVFETLTSFSGEWEVDETLKTKEQQGDKGCIVVAVDNGGPNRINEYSPFVNPEYGGGQGDLYLDFLTVTLKPFIDSAYRTLPAKKYTGIAGSSMGGLISAYAAVKYPDVYGRIGVFSPALWFSDSLFSYIEMHAKTTDSRFYIVAGKHESETMETDINRFVLLLQSKGYQKDQFNVLIHEDGKHTEWFWRREFGSCYDWLFNTSR